MFMRRLLRMSFWRRAASSDATSPKRSETPIESPGNASFPDLLSQLEKIPKTKQPKPEGMRMTSSDGEIPLIEGVPLAEYNQVVMGACVRCGRPAEETGEGKIVEMEARGQIIYTTTLCTGCMSPEELEDYAVNRAG